MRLHERAPRTHAGWASAEAAVRYSRGRFSTARAAGRDPATVARLLRRHLGGERVLDVPHGTGRLAPALAGLRWIGLDRSAAMLSEARAAHPAPLVLGALERLPFQDDAFDAVVCCRLLHHLDEERELPAAVRELVRVSRDLVLASFWDAGSLHGWRRRAGLRREPSRRPVTKRRLEQTFLAAGARVVGYAHGLRFVSMQTFAVARKHG